MFKFSALAARMKYINRWGLMRNAHSETLAEHTADTAIISHLLALIAARDFGAEVSPERVATAALYHDCTEIITGDLPTPVKYSNAEMTRQYKNIEREASARLLSMLPEGVSKSVGGLMSGQALNERERAILKAADKLSGLIKCIEERRLGSTEFASAEKTLSDAVSALDLPEAKYFVQNFLPAHSLDLDALLK